MRRIQLLFILAAISSACSQPGNDSSQTKSLHPDAQTPTVFAVDTVKSSCQAAAPQNINITMSTGLAASPPPGIAGANMDASGKVWAFIENGPRGMFVQINGKTHPTFDTIEKEKGVFDQSGHHFAYSAERSGKWFVVRDGVTSKASYDGIYNESVIFDPTGTHLVFNAKLNGQSFAVLDGVEQAHFDDLSPVAFSDDGSHSAYTALKDGSGFLIIDGETKVKTPGRGSMIPVWMHADKFAYLINAGETLQVIVPDGLPQPFLKEFTYDKPLVWSLRFAKQDSDIPISGA